MALSFTRVENKRKAKRAVKYAHNCTKKLLLEAFEVEWKHSCEMRLAAAIRAFEQAHQPTGETPEEKQQWLNHNLAVAQVHFETTKPIALEEFLAFHMPLIQTS